MSKKLKFCGSVKSLKLKQDSVVVVSFNYSPSADELLDFEQKIGRVFPNNTVIVLSAKMNMDVIE